MSVLSLSLSRCLCVSLSLFLLHPLEPHTSKAYIVPLSYTTAKGHFHFEMVELPTLPWFLKLCLKAAKDLCSSHACDSWWCRLSDAENQAGHKWTFPCLFCPTSLSKSHSDVASTALSDSGWFDSQHWYLGWNKSKLYLLGFGGLFHTLCSDRTKSLHTLESLQVSRSSLFPRDVWIAADRPIGAQPIRGSCYYNYIFERAGDLFLLIFYF